MKLNKMLVIAGMVFASGVTQFAQAQAEKIGNGGDAVVCNGGNDVYLLDYIEAKQRGIHMMKDPSSETVRQIVFSALEKLSKVDDRGNHYKSLANSLLNDIESFNGTEKIGEVARFTEGELTDIEDSRELALPKECFKKQLIIQRTPVFKEDRMFEISAPLWIKMSPQQQAFAVMHEVVYNEAIKLGEKDSVSTRYLNSKIFSGYSFNICEWKDVLKDLPSFKLTFKNNSISEKLSCYGSGAIKSYSGWIIFKLKNSDFMGVIGAQLSENGKLINAKSIYVKIGESSYRRASFSSFSFEQDGSIQLRKFIVQHEQMQFDDLLTDIHDLLAKKHNFTISEYDFEMK